MAGLDEDFDFDDPDNQLEDDFVVQAMDGEVEFHEEDEDDMEEAGPRRCVFSGRVRRSRDGLKESCTCHCPGPPPPLWTPSCGGGGPAWHYIVT